MVKYKIEYYLTRLAGMLAKGLSPKAVHIIGHLFGDLFYYVIKIRRKRAFNNIKNAFPEIKSDDEINGIVHRNYRHFGKMFLEFARVTRISKEKIIQEVEIENREILETALDKGKGVLVLSGHFGNWEHLAASVAQIGPPLHAVFKAQKNLLVDELIKKQRLNVGLVPLKVKGGAARGIISALRQGAKVLILFDQDAGKKGKFVNFLGTPASTNDGAARIAIRFGIPSIFAVAVRTKQGNYKIKIEDFPSPDQFENSDEGVTQFIETYNSYLEKYIRKYPDQYFWMHRRWLAWERIQKKQAAVQTTIKSQPA